MYLYFFDLDDTICNTLEVIESLKNKYNISEEDYKSKEDYHQHLDLKLFEYGLEKIKPLQNSTVSLLQELLKSSPQDIYYITARETRARSQSKEWLKENNLWLGEEKLIMDTKGIKGKTINNILNNSDKKFAFLFDDLMDNHKEAAKYKKIISCFPF